MRVTAAAFHVEEGIRDSTRDLSQCFIIVQDAA